MSAGRVLAGRYRLLDQVAVGAMGEVWRAHDDRLDRDVAVKVLRPELADDEGFVERFRTEALHAASVRHPHVAAVHDYGEDELVLTGGAATAYLVMDLLEGRTLGALLEAGGPMPEDRVARLLAQVADALAAAHRAGLVHRDVKPANLVVSQGPPEDVTVTDFGIARAADAVPVTRTGLVMGTAEYLSPEQARGERATTASDVYSLGVVAQELLTGRPPLSGPSPAEVARAHVQDPPPDLPTTCSAASRATVARCLLKEPWQRPTAEELAERLRAVADGTAPDAWPAPDHDPAAPLPHDDDLPAAFPRHDNLPAAAPRHAGLAAATPRHDDLAAAAPDARPSLPAAAPPHRAARAGGALPAAGVPSRSGTREIPVVGRPARAPASPGLLPRETPCDPPCDPPAAALALPLRAPAVALLALLALLLLATVLQQAGLIGSGDDDPGAAPAHPVTGSPGTTTHEDGR